MDNLTEARAVDFAARFEGAKGRPIRNRMASARVTMSELKRLEEAARDEGKLLAEWGREVLLREAGKPKQDPLFTELISLRMLLNNILKVLATGQKITAENYQAIQQGVRADKKRVAFEILQQYTAATGEER